MQIATWPENLKRRWLSPEELNKEIRNRKIIEAVILRKLFIKALYAGKDEVGISKVTGYSWLKEGNEKELEDLKPNYF